MAKQHSPKERSVTVALPPPSPPCRPPAPRRRHGLLLLLWWWWLLLWGAGYPRGLWLDPPTPPRLLISLRQSLSAYLHRDHSALSTCLLVTTQVKNTSPRGVMCGKKQKKKKMGSTGRRRINICQPVVTDQPERVTRGGGPVMPTQNSQTRS